MFGAEVCRLNFNEHEFWAQVQKVVVVGDFRKFFHVFATIDTCQGRIGTRFALNVNYLFQGFLSQFFVDFILALSFANIFVLK